MYYDFHGYPIEFEEWAKLFENTQARRVGSNWLGSSQYWVSTVWLGQDYRQNDEGKPIIYETMVFHGDDSIYMERSCTWDEAEEAHIRALIWTMKQINMKRGLVYDE